MRSAILKIDITSFFSAEGGPIWIKLCRLVQNNVSTAVIWSKLKPDIEFQYGGRLGEFNDVSSQSQLSHCRVLPDGEFIVMIPNSEARYRLRIAISAYPTCIQRPRYGVPVGVLPSHLV